MQKLLKALNFMNHMHEYKMKCFSKTLVLNLVFPKNKIFNQDPYIFKHQTCFAKTQGIFKLGWPNQNHTQ